MQSELLIFYFEHRNILFLDFFSLFFFFIVLIVHVLNRAEFGFQSSQRTFVLRNVKIDLQLIKRGLSTVYVRKIRLLRMIGVLREKNLL